MSKYSRVLLLISLLCFQVSHCDDEDDSDEHHHHHHHHHDSHEHLPDLLSDILHGHRLESWNHHDKPTHHLFHKFVDKVIDHISQNHLGGSVIENHPNKPTDATPHQTKTLKEELLPFNEWRLVWDERGEDCGRPEIDPLKEKKITGGRIDPPGSWPWMVSLKFDPIHQHLCGGILISDQWVLSASHCFIPGFPTGVIQNWTARLGVQNAHPFGPEQLNEQRINISKLILHRRSQVMYDHDIALVKLEKPIQRNKWVVPICLPNEEDYTEETGRECSITGYGTTDDKKQLVLHEARVPFYDREECLDLYKENITENMICAGYKKGGVDTCPGDSGGPLQCLDEDQWRLYGITSNGPSPCATPEKPGLYTKVVNYVSWIKEEIYLDYRESFEN